MKIVLILLLLILSESTLQHEYKQTHKQKLRKQKNKVKHRKQEDQVELLKLDVRLDQEQMAEVIGGTDFVTFEKFKILMKNRGLIPGEIQFLFNTADRTKSNKIKQVEWTSFFRVFIEPFEKCDEDKNYLLNKDELVKCLDEDDYLKELRVKDVNVEKLMELLYKDEEHLINFADYMYLRRVNLAWGDCAGGTMMSRIQVPCGFKMVVPGMIATEQDVKQVFDIVMAFSTGKASQMEPYLQLVDFIQTSYIYYFFYAFQIPYSTGLVKKSDMKRAVDYQIVQIGLNANIIDKIYGELSELNFKTFSVSLIIFQQFRKYSKVNKYGMSEEEFIECLKQHTFNSNFLKSVENVYIPDFKEYEEASFKPEVEWKERDFLVTFLQTSYKQKKHLSHQRKHHHQLKHRQMEDETQSSLNQIKQLRFKTKKDDPSYDEDKQKLVYRQFEFKNKQSLDFPHFLRYFKFTWLFINYDTNGNGFLNYQEIRNGIEQYEAPIPLSLQETQWLQWSMDFVANPVLDEFDLKQWYSQAQFHDVFDFYKQSAFTSFITEPKLKMALYQLGYKTTPMTLDLSKVSKDPTTQKPLYNYWTAFKLTVKEEIISQKQHNFQVIEDIVKDVVKL